MLFWYFKTPVTSASFLVAECCWFMSWEDSDTEYPSLTLFSFSLLIVLIDLSWETIEVVMFVGDFQFSCKMFLCFVHIIHMKYWLWHMILFSQTFFLDPSESLLFCLISVSYNKYMVSIQKGWLCSYYVNLFNLLPYWRVRDSSRGRFRAGS